MKTSKNYSYLKSNTKSLKMVVLIFISLLITGLEVKYPAVYAIVGYVLSFAYDWLKHKWQIKLP